MTELPIWNAGPYEHSEYGPQTPQPAVGITLMPEIPGIPNPSEIWPEGLPGQE
jgi:hypothetical protein